MEKIASFFGLGSSTTFADGICHMLGTFGNCCVVETDEGLVIFDIAQERFGSMAFNQLRTITDKPIKYLIYSHGHFDHCFGFKPFIDEIKEKGNWKMPQIIAHANCLRRWKKYKILDKYHKWLNRQQFASVIGDDYEGPSAFNTLDPSIIIHDDEFHFELGGLSFEIHHEWGETDDALWLWFPKKKVIFSGDLIISGFPNVGNPYKVQRYPKHWAIAMENMLEKNAHYLVPGHGTLIEGKEKVRDVLSITAEVMHFVHDEVVKRMNQGRWFEQIYHEMIEIYPDKFKKHEYLSPVYGCYRFAIHAVYRLYHGWYNSGNPTDLFPAKSDDIARELLKINNATKYIEHGKKLVEEGKLQLALHLIDPVILGLDPKNSEVLLEALRLKSNILEQQARNEHSFIASNILNNEVIQLKSKISEFQVDKQ
ncbi:MAG: alkyl sulfatase dimerization domain-containing protein [Candidatus Hodarchaeales archaeon]|jgi:alkyl sulfatase BDS1-like metallo-beta-lactamase superfamily hydrolase